MVCMYGILGYVHIQDMSHTYVRTSICRLYKLSHSFESVVFMILVFMILVFMIFDFDILIIIVSQCYGSIY